MILGGFQKLTLLDFPGKVACTVFTKGCNFRCPFCHNAFLVEGKEEAESIDSKEVTEYLKKRQGILEGVCITGGEPLISNGLEEFIKEVKEMGFSVKLDTNGSYPEKLKDLVKKGLVDYVAMDVKNSFEKYSLTSGKEVDISKIEESIAFLISSGIDYEFRTTVSKELHTPSDIEKIGEKIKGAKKYFLQNFVDSGNTISKNLSPVDAKTLEEMRQKATLSVPEAAIRGQ